MLRLARTNSAVVIESTYAAAVLFALTQGPIYRIWSESVAVEGEVEIPNAIHVHFATFIVLQLPALALLARRIDAKWLRNNGVRMLCAFLGWLAICSMTSTLARKSIPDFTALLLTSVFGLYLARSFRLKAIWSIVTVATSAGVMVSTLAAYRLWDGAVNLQQDYWIGIYFNRNSLAPVAAMAIIGCFGVVTTFRWRKTPRSIVVAALLAIALAYSVQALVQSRSRTSLAALAVAAILAGMWSLTQWGIQRFLVSSSVRRFSLPTLLLLFGFGVWASFYFLSGTSEIDREVTSFNSRGALWSQAWSGVLAKPVLGWGWLAAWHVREFWEQGQWWSVWGENDWSHSGYFDVMLGGGFPAAALFLMFVLFSSHYLGLWSSLRDAVAQVLLLGFVLTAATQESFFVGSHFLWALLIAVLLHDASTNEHGTTEASP